MLEKAREDRPAICAHAMSVAASRTPQAGNIDTPNTNSRDLPETNGILRCRVGGAEPTHVSAATLPRSAAERDDLAAALEQDRPHVH
eukprot:3232963-Rhodomonas_salina.4